MSTIEIYARTGGKDAELFAREIGTAISKKSGQEINNNEKVITIQYL